MDTPVRPKPTHRRRRVPLSAVAVGALAAGLIALLVFGLSRQSPDTTIADALAAGRLAPAPAFELELLERGALGPRLEPRLGRALTDGRVALRELRGGPVVLNLWASWCDPCRQEARLLQRTWAQARRDGVLFVGLNMQDIRDDARDFLRQYRVDYLTIREPDKDTARAYGATGIPETFFLTADGRVAAHVVGVTNAAQLRAGIAAARSGRALPGQAGGDRRATR